MLAHQALSHASPARINLPEASPTVCLVRSGTTAPVNLLCYPVLVNQEGIAR